MASGSIQVGTVDFVRAQTDFGDIDADFDVVLHVPGL
jgi:hypothetical protein